MISTRNLCSYFIQCWVVIIWYFCSRRFPGLRTEGIHSHIYTSTCMYILYRYINRRINQLERCPKKHITQSFQPPHHHHHHIPSYRHSGLDPIQRVGGVGGGGCGGGSRLLISGLGVVCTTYACCRTVVVQSTDARTTT